MSIVNFRVPPEADRVVLQHHNIIIGEAIAQASAQITGRVGKPSEFEMVYSNGRHIIADKIKIALSWTERVGNGSVGECQIGDRVEIYFGSWRRI